ncbi:thymidylate synthase [Brevundimonas sp.]|uniref:thymidylate synthase n=1 Tax=Brevundimonas sp. TaxID=1871086 RepID=UPI0025BDEE5A|nr:thymidylate synthase [Brevundimonas sp.]
MPDHPNTWLGLQHLEVVPCLDKTTARVWEAARKMYLKASTLDDLLDEAFRLLQKSKMGVVATKGSTVEVQGIVLELTRPRARLSRTDTKGTVFSGIGEFIWYISCNDKLAPIQYYIKRYDEYAEADGTIWGAYGPRIFGGERSQYEIVKALLSKRASSRQAVIQLFDRRDIEERRKDTPCTCTLQFLVRDGLLNLVVHMRSNDVYKGLPHDVFAFTMFQEILARDLGVALGTYKHMVGSLHLYEEDRAKIDAYVHEGFQSTREMPDMPAGSQWTDIKTLFVVEAAIRKGGVAEIPDALDKAKQLSPYWADIARLLAIFALTRKFDGAREKLRQVVEIRRAMSTQYYAAYIRKNSRRLSRAVAQLDLDGSADIITKVSIP